MLSVELNEEQYQEILFLYKYFGIEPNPISTALRKLYHAIYSEKINPSDTPTLSTNHTSELELLEGWDCVYRVLIHPYHKISKKREPMIWCTHPKVREYFKTNEIYIEVCKNCHENGGSLNTLSLSAPKKQDSISKEKEEFLKKAQSKNRKCLTCGKDISKLEDWKTLCLSCWKKNQNPASQSETKPLRGSPMDLRKQEADAIRRANERMNENGGMNIN